MELSVTARHDVARGALFQYRQRRKGAEPMAIDDWKLNVFMSNFAPASSAARPRARST
jgi:hypothetical protein